MTTGAPVEVPSGPGPPADVSTGSDPNLVSSQKRDPLLADAPLRDPALDRFGFAAFAKALALIIDHERTATPLTIAVSAPWGGGKSSLGGMVETLLTDRVARRYGDDPRLVCWFNAWEHEDASHLGAALVGAVARAADRRRPWWRRAISPLPGAMLGARERAHRTWVIAAVSLATAVLLRRRPRWRPSRQAMRRRCPARWAVSLFEKNSDRAARVAYAKSRKEMAGARADAAKAIRQADSASDHVRAASAQRLLAAQQDENIQALSEALRPADGRDESKIAAAARADTKGREKAIAILTELLGKVPKQARTGIAKAIANLSTDRIGEVSAMSTALRSKHVSNTNKRRVVSALKVDVEGQTDAATILAALIASPDMPAESKQGLQAAYENVTAEHGSVADILSRFNSRMPSFVRDFVSQIITQARTDAQGMRDNHPTGPPAGTPGGAPSTTPGGAPSSILPGLPAA